MVNRKEGADVGLAIGSREEFASPPPVFDMDKAEIAGRFVDIKYRGLFSEFLSLRLALILASYNFLAKGGDEKNLDKTSTRFDALIQQELTASDPRNSLPTIGLEVETPRKPLKLSLADNNLYEQYAQFFDLVGMPRNKINTGKSKYSYWEFSPFPSYSVLVQARILSELIKGGFIPSLNQPYDPNLIMEELDQKMVSLHVNLGIPNYLGIDPHNQELNPFACALTFAFDSPERLLYRRSSEFFNVRELNVTALNRGFKQRLEIKALEVSNSSAYRLLHEAQVLGSALFASLSMDDKIADSLLARKWIEIREKIYEVFAGFGKNITYPPNKWEAYQLSHETDISLQLRHLLDRRTHEVETILKTKTLLHLRE